MDIVKAMPQGIQSDIASKTKHIERAARHLIGIPITIYTPEELKSAMFAFAGGNYSRNDIFDEFGVGDSTLRKKMQALRTSMELNKEEFDQLMDRNPCKIKDAIDNMSFKKRGNQYYLQDTEVHFIGAIAQEALEVGYGKDKSAMQALVKDVVHNVGNDMIIEGTKNNNDKQIKRGEKLKNAVCSKTFMTQNIGCSHITENRMNPINSVDQKMQFQKPHQISQKRALAMSTDRSDIFTDMVLKQYDDDFKSGFLKTPMPNADQCWSVDETGK